MTFVRFLVGCKKRMLSYTPNGLKKGWNVYGNVRREDSQSLAFQAKLKNLGSFFLGGQLHELPQAKFHALLFSGNL